MKQFKSENFTRIWIVSARSGEKVNYDLTWLFWACGVLLCRCVSR